MPSHVTFEYNKQLKVRLKILFVSLPVFPYPFKLSKKLKKVPSNVKKNSYESETVNTIKRNRSLGSIKSIKKIIRLLRLTSRKILRHIKIKNIYFILGVKGEDAADTAIKFGQAHILINNLFSRISSKVDIKNLKINIYPGFLETKNNLYFKIDIHSRFAFILYEIMIFALNYAKISKDN